jgi:hypothetical protein
MFMPTAKKKPALLVSRGKISLGINQPKGPHDHAKPDTNTQTKMTTSFAEPFGMILADFKCTARILPIMDYIQKKKMNNDQSQK